VRGVVAEYIINLLYIGLASHWPCVTDSVVYPPTSSMAMEREMSTLLTPERGTARFTFIQSMLFLQVNDEIAYHWY